MAQPSSRAELIDYCKRQLGAPVLEINVADEQISDLVDDAVQMFQERHYDGVVQMPLKYKVTQADIDRGRSRGNNKAVGIVTTTATSTIVGTAVTFSYEENSNYIQLPDSVIGVNKIFRFDGSNTITNNMFSVKYQMFLNDVYYFDSIELLSYAMVKTKLEDIDFLINTEKQIRFNKRKGRLYIDTNFGTLGVGNYIIIDAYTTTTAADFTRVYNDSFVKRYLTALMKRQWGMNLIKFQGVKLPGGIELNGRQIYEDGQKEVDTILERSKFDYEELPLDLIG